ncbi:hypothetical protein AWU67_10370 [Microterricola viridarii]|uniref:GmrSD restriction endonucleases C-terminal domain-containing protein n=2 Tax=Microterricola viridarii TaxID=412690 RepID=A0A0X8E451_9MICO|nr:hypothetical protein AWU67_10370 [Microterricola viridarii]
MSTKANTRRTLSRRRRALAGWAVVPVLLAIGIAAVTALTEPAETAPAAPAPPAASGTALEQLGTLPVKGRAPKTGYDRTVSFGTAWRDVDQNGCDTRNDVLARDLTAIDRPAGCRVLSGRLADPYTGTTIDFVRGQGTSQAVQIDHVVALMNAWETGAQQLTVERRTELANDPLNLLAVEGRANSQKGAGDAATWLPPSKGYRCEYVARQVAVKANYNLWVTQAEHDAIEGVLAGCPGQPAPAQNPPA